MRIVTITLKRTVLRMLDVWCVRLGTAIVRILLLYRLRRPKLTPAYLISMGRTSLAGSER